MAIKETPIPRIRHSLTHSELIILRSIALGLGCDTIRDLLELSMPDYQKMCMGLFEKLQVCNAYAAVQTAYHNNILKTKEYTPEKVKGIALKYADLFQKNPITKNEDRKRMVWELYDLLLEFYNAVESSFMLVPEKKKSHRSGT